MKPFFLTIASGLLLFFFLPLQAQEVKIDPFADPKVLFKSLTHKEAVQREAALDYIKIEKPPSLIPYLKKAILAKKWLFFSADYTNRPVCEEALRLYPFSVSLKYWIEILQETGSATMKLEVMNYISSSGHRSIVMPIVEELKNPFFIVRQGAAKILRGRGDDRVYPFILSMMNDPAPVVRVYAIEAMNYLYDSRFQREFLNMINDGDAWVRVSVIYSIRHNRIENTIHIIRNSAMNDGDGRVRFAAINFLLENRDPALSGILTKAINEHDRITRLSAVNAFSKLNLAMAVTYFCTRLQFEEDDEIKEIIVDSLVHRESVPSTAGIVKVLRGDKDVSLRVKAAFLLGLRRDIQTMYSLIDALKDEQDTVRAEACNSLANYQMIQATDALVRAISGNKSRYVRSAALYAIVKSKTRNATVGLFDIFAHEQEPVLRDHLYKTLRELIVKYH
ncbi:MAG: HEAT repeat domain-containing protein [Leptospirales bacterium]|nr:HEAT repeat domain-containing protein [Leptospirales bacterium]